MSKRRMGGGGSRGRRIGPMLASGRGGRTGPPPPGMQAPLSPRRTPVVPETRRKPPRGMTEGGQIMKKKGYAKGGLQNGMTKKKSKFPDLSGDGKVTQKDILMGKGVVKKKNGGPIMKKKGFAAGGLQNGMKMKKKGYAKGGKVRGCGIATKGVRKAKMVTMKGS